MYHGSAFRLTWLKAFLSLIPALFFGWLIGQLIYMSGHCSRGGTNCLDYSPTKIAFSYLLSWPLMLLNAVLGKYASFWQGIVPLWLYYYFLACVVDQGEREVRQRYLD